MRSNYVVTMKTIFPAILASTALGALALATLDTASAKDAEKAVVTLDSKSFESKVASNEGVALVDFWATWCGPCIALAPTVEDVAKDYKGKVTVGKVDVDKVKDVTEKYKIQAMPTLIIFKDGKEVDRIVGGVPKATITAKLDAALKK